MDYLRVVETYERIEATTKRLEMTDLLVQLFRDVHPDIIDKVVYLTQGRVYPDYVGIELGMAEKSVMKVLAFATGISQERIEDIWKELGDLGLVAERVVAEKRQRSLFTEPLTLERVYGAMVGIAGSGGAGSQERKMKLLADVLHSATPVEAKYIVRTVVGKMRLGVADMTIVDALAATFSDVERRDDIERAYNVSSDLGEVARILVQRGIDGLSDVHLKLNRPVRSMLCERLESLDEILERLGRCAFEYKYDGLRMQAHIGKVVQIFSRQLENITTQFPEIAQALKSAFKGKEGIVEGEAVPVDVNTGEFLPFQEVSHRRGRKFEVEAMSLEFPVHLFLFDCLYLDGRDLTTEPYEERRRRLESCIEPRDKIMLSEVLVTDSKEETETFFERALQDGCEGLVSKALSSKYEAGARGFQWIKYKREYKSEMSDTVDLVVVGAFAGRGKRAGTYGALLMASYDKDSDTFKTVCKLGTGFDDETLFSLPERFRVGRRDRRHARVDSKMEPDVWFEPRHVLEVRGAELTLSPVHTAAWGQLKANAGLAVRFPRFTGRWRDDKSPEEATSILELVEMYQAQLKTIKAA